MPSSSTGYHSATITKEQPSSSGQLLVFSSGCKLNMKNGSEIEMESGSTMNIESGAVVKVASGGKLTDQNVATTTSTSITNYGFTVINTTKVHTLDAPSLGCKKKILMLPSTGEKARVKTGSTAIFFNSSDDKSFCLNVKSNSSKAANFGYPVTLRGESTTQWWLMADQGDNISVSSTATATVTNLGYTATLTATSS